MKTKTLNKKAMIANICGLSLGDRAYCGPYGIVTCTAAADGTRFRAEHNVSGNFRGMQLKFKRNSRRFSVSGSVKIHNGGGWTMKGLREAIGA